MRQKTTQLIICISYTSSKHSLILGKHQNTPSSPHEAQGHCNTEGFNHLLKVVEKIRNRNQCRLADFLLCIRVFENNGPTAAHRWISPISFPITLCCLCGLRCSCLELLVIHQISHTLCPFMHSLPFLEHFTPTCSTQTSFFLFNSYLYLGVGLKHHFLQRPAPTLLPQVFGTFFHSAVAAASKHPPAESLLRCT